MTRHFLRCATAAATLCCVAGAATGQPVADPQAAAAAPLTRAQVVRELMQYRRSGVNPWSTSYNPLRTFHSEKSREQVTANFIAHREAAVAMLGEDSGSVFIALQNAATLQAASLEIAAAMRSQR